jgi:type IV secretion system protein VirD4
MILFYEGLRPVLAHRILYFRDRVFAKRELPPPPVPPLDVHRSSRAIAAARAVTPDGEEDAAGANPGSITNATPPGGGSTLTKEGSTMASDVLNADLKLDDFSFDFDDVEIPSGKLSDEVMKRRADEFMARLLD